MAAIALTIPRLWSVTPRLVDNASDLKGPLGGAHQRIARLGSRYAADIEFGSLNREQAAVLLGQILKARATVSTVSVTWPQATGGENYGAVLVNGGSQAGTSLVVDGVAGRQIKPGRFFSFSVSGRSYLHCTTDLVTADGSGNATLAISPMLRTSPADNTALEFRNPIIEGFLPEAVQEWSIDMLTRTTGFKLTIEEVE